MRLLVGIPLLMVLFFLPAGTYAYWEAWLYMAMLVAALALVVIYLLNHNPELLARRLRLREREPAQRWIARLSYLYFLLIYLLPSFDRRFGWSNVPAAVVVAADAVVLLGYGLCFLVFKENRFASRIIEVEAGQQVISSGPYGIVRHPMYAGVALMYLFSPLALGSYWAMLPALLIIPILVARIRHEEGLLERELPGYREYAERTKYRLVPGLW